MASSVIAESGKANTFGSTKTFALNEEYICPCDGYVQCSCGATSTAQAIATIYDSNGSYIRLGGFSGSTYAVWSCYVRKGMKVKATTVANNGVVQFIPLA